MKCPLCGSSDTHRSRRKGFDVIWAWFNRWPYQCRRCSRRFRSGSRYPTGSRLKEQNRQKSNPPQQPVSGKIQVRTHPNEPIAGIVVQAESQSELNSILLTLNQALASYGRASQPQQQREHSWK